MIQEDLVIPPDDVRRFFAEYFGMEPDAIPMGMRTMLEEIMDAVAEMNRGIRGYLPAGPEVAGLLTGPTELEVEPEATEEQPSTAMDAQEALNRAGERFRNRRAAEALAQDTALPETGAEGESDLDGLAGNTALSVGERMEETSFAEVRPAEVGRQRRAGAYYPDIGRWIANTAFSIGERRKAEYRAVIGKKRPDLPSADVDAFMGEMDKLGDTKAEKAALHWFVKGGLQLPEDGEKLGTALKTVAKFKLDPFAFASPDELLAEADRRNPKKQVLPYIDPDTVPELTNKRDLGHGVVVYDVANTAKGQAAMRRIMNSHLGREANGSWKSPWCLLSATDAGEVSTSAKKYWRRYNKTGRNAAFQNGRLIAFQSSDRDEGPEWWDLQDDSHGKDIQIETRMNAEDAVVTVWAEKYHLVDENGAPLTGEIVGVADLRPDGTLTENYPIKDVWFYRGNKENGAFETWGNGGRPIAREHYKDGVLDGVSYRFGDGVVTEEHWKNGKRVGIWETRGVNDGRLHQRVTYTGNGKEETNEVFWDNGNLASVYHLDKDGGWDGARKSFYEDGVIRSEDNYKHNKLHGASIEYRRNGDFSSYAEFHDGQMVSPEFEFYDDGPLRRAEFRDFENPRDLSVLVLSYFGADRPEDAAKEAKMLEAVNMTRARHKLPKVDSLDVFFRDTQTNGGKNPYFAPSNTALSAAMRATGSIDERFPNGAAVFRTLDAIERTALPTVLPEPVRRALADWTRERNGAARKQLVTAVLGAIPERERFYMDTGSGRRLPLSNNAVDSVLFGHASSDSAVAGKAAFLLAIPAFSTRAVQVYSEGYGNGRHTTYVAPVSYGNRQVYGTATVSGAGADLSLHEINYFDPMEKVRPARTTTLQQKSADRRSYSDGPNTKRILQLIHDNQALSRDELNERIHELGGNTALSVGERPGRAPVVEPGGDVREAGEGALAWLRRKFVHSQSPVFEAVRRVMGVGREPPDALNVEAAAKNVHGKIRARQELLQRAYLEPLKAILAQPGMDRKRFDDYALALHALERNRMIQERSVVVDPTSGEVVDLGVEAGSGVTNAWAERVIREIQRDPFAEQYKEAANILAEMNRFVLRGAVADGLLTEAQARTWMRLSPHYVPLKSGGAAPGAIHKRATGRFTRPDSVLVNSMRQAYATVRNGELNRVNKTMADWIREYDPNGEQVGGTVPESHKHAKIKMADPQYVPKGSTAEALLRERGIRLVETEDKGGYWVDTGVLPNALKRVVRESVPQGDDIVTFWENGERKFIRFEGKRGRDGRAENEAARIADALNFKNVLHKEGKFWDAIRGLTRWKANVSTSWNPTFIVRNMGADVFNTANLMMIEGKYAELAQTMRNYPAALNRVERSSHAWVSFTDGVFPLAEAA